MVGKLVASAAASYMLGSLNLSWWLGRKTGHDMKKEGSKNAGASNALLLIGKYAFFAVLFADMFKSWLCWKLTELFVPEASFAGVFGGFWCTMGHVFPVFLHFNGGKGFACLGGMIMAYSPWLFLIQLALAWVIALATHYLCFASTTAPVIFAAVYWYGMKDIPGTFLIGVIAAVMIAKHIENFRRIPLGTEAKMSYIFNKNKELERLGYGDQIKK